MMFRKCFFTARGKEVGGVGSVMWGEFWERHPSRKIVGEQGRELEGKRLVLGVTSSVSLYRSIDVARAIMRMGGETTVVMSGEAARLVSPELFEWATGRPVFHTRFHGETGHIYLSETHDAMAIVPATANTIAKLAHGVGDTPVTLTALSMMGHGKPVLVLPTMHRQLYESPQNRRNLEQLRRDGVIIHEPVFEGDRAKFPEAWEVAWHLETLLARGSDLRGLRILVTAGATREYLDPVRFISNPSSGKMGVSVALEALYRGGEVSLVHGPLCSPLATSLRRSYGVETTEEMLNATLAEMGVFKPHIIVLAAAPVDFKPVVYEERKIKSGEPPTISFSLTPKIISQVTERKPRESVLVAFAAETVDDDEELLRLALEKKAKYRADVIVANNVARKDVGFASDYNEVIIAYSEKHVKIPRMNKRLVARRLLDIALQVYREKNLR